MQGLRHQDLIVRWSAAKGLGRLTVRLPKELGDEVVGSVLAIMNAREVPHAWHGGCLALAELGRRGLLLPSRLPEVVPIVLKALAFDEKRANLPVGAVIRDSACYVCWAFARAYDTDVLKPYINSIASALLVVTVFDREINCRRAASAAFQENVGRQGAFPHGLDILTTADFFAVGIRNNSYLNISVFIAQFEEYTAPLIDHLLQKKVDHWDIAIRELAGKALHNLTHLAPGYMVATVLPELLKLANSIDLYGRHGAIMALGEVLLALANCLPHKKTIESALGEKLLEQIRQLVPSMRQKQQFLGMGGDLMRQSVASFIKNASSANLPFHENDVIGDWQWVLTDSLSQVDPQTRSRAVEALPSFCEHYFKDESGPIKARQEPLISHFVSQLNSTTQTTRMGYALALGRRENLEHPVSFMFMSQSAKVVRALIISAAIGSMAPTDKWAESRRDALLALASVCATTGTSLDEDGNWYTLEGSTVLISFLEGLLDYTRDSRGDVGAWVREAAMAGLQTLVQLVLEVKPCKLSEDFMGDVMGRVAQNAIERIDRTRKQAGKVFSTLLHSSPENEFIPHRAELLKIFPAEVCKDVNWSAEVQTFPLFTQVLALPTYSPHILLGLIASVGGVTESLVSSLQISIIEKYFIMVHFQVKHASSSLFSYLQQQTREELGRICDCILTVFQKNLNNERVTLPLLRFLDRILNSGVLSGEDGTLPGEFAIGVVKLVVKETTKCTSPVKLIEAIPVLCQVAGMRGVEKKAGDTAMSYLVIYLCHRFPRVRAVTAEQMYEAMIVEEDAGQVDMETVLTLLSDTNWADETLDILRPIRNQLCDLLAVPKPKVAPKVSALAQ
ncbi:hypothetical protein B566_EDAN005290 [Ephemera danica]|nr:hypothetical protein B566_EDAN005290 [Ephemera danica]